VATQPLNPAYKAVQDNVNEQKMAALTALSEGGSAGMNAYKAVQANLGAARQQALNAAAKRSALIGGPEAAAANYVTPINTQYDAATQRALTEQGSFSNMINSLKGANAEYYNQIAAALPLNQAYSDAQRSSKLTESQKDAEIYGTAQRQLTEQGGVNEKRSKDLKSTQAAIQKQIAAADKEANDAYNQYWQIKRSAKPQVQMTPQGPAGYTPAAPQDPNQLKGLLAKGQAAVKRKAELESQLKKLPKDQQYKQEKKTLQDFATENAQKYGYTPEQSQFLFGAGGKKDNDFQSQALKGSLAPDIAAAKAMAKGGTPPKTWSNVPKTKGRVSREDFISQIEKDESYSDAEKTYIIGSVAGSFPTKKQLKKEQ
jgi:hypothetical protein